MAPASIVLRLTESLVAGFNTYCFKPATDKNPVPDVIEDILRGVGLHIYSRRTFEHESDRAFELELIGTTKQIDVAIDELRRLQDVVSVSID